MRKIWSSANVAWSDALSALALQRSVPNGFSMMIRDRSASPAWLSVRTTPSAALGGTLR